MSLVNMTFIRKMAECLEEGLREGREPNDWKEGETLDFTDALLRHLELALREGASLPETKDHLVAIAVNAMILWWHCENPIKWKVVTPPTESPEIDLGTQNLPGKVCIKWGYKDAIISNAGNYWLFEIPNKISFFSQIKRDVMLTDADKKALYDEGIARYKAETR